MSRTKKKNFTLVEIMAVISIIAVLAGLTVGVSSVVMRKAADAKTQSAIKMLEMALAKYKEKLGHYPIKPGQGMLFAKSDPATPANDDPIWKYLDEKFKRENARETSAGSKIYYFIDGYGNPLVYRCPGHFNRGKFDLGSAGKDGRFGGDNEGTQFTENAIDTNFDNYKAHFGKGDDIVNFSNNAEL